MDLILFHPAEYNHLYNCSFYDVDHIPLEKRQRLVIGWIFIALFFVFEILYIPCIFAIGKNLCNASFKFMFYIGIADIIVLWDAGLVSGYLAITGAVFCSHPTLIYISGIIALFFWTAVTTASMVLALNRFILVCSPSLARTLYQGKMAWLWLVPVTLYALLTVYFGKPPVFSSIYLAWFYNPHVGYFDDYGAVYHNYVASAHNLMVSGGLAILYIGFCIALLYKRHYYDDGETKFGGKSDKVPFLQVFLITIVNMITSAIYVLMQFVPINESLIILAEFTWILAHGLPPVIYLTMNRTIRNEAYQMWLKILHRKNTVSAVSSHTVPTTD